MRRLLLSALFLLSLINLGATTFYVDFEAGLDSNNGTAQGTPWKHAPGMANVAGVPASYSVQAGDVFVLKGGITWTFASTTDHLLTVLASGITIRGGQRLGNPWGSGMPVLDGTGSTDTRAGIYALYKSSVTVDGIKIHGTCYTAGGSGSGISSLYAGGSWEIENCMFDGTGVESVGYSPLGTGSGFLFHDNTVQNCGRLQVDVADGVVFDNVQLYNNVMLGPGTYNPHGYHCDGFMIGANCTTKPSTLTNILIHDNKFSGDWSGQATALIYLNDASGPTGTYARYGGYHCKIYNNQLCIDSNGVISPALIDIADGWQDVQIYNNTLNAVATGGNAIGIAIAGFYLDSDAAIVVKNNIISGCDNGISFGDLNAAAYLPVPKKTIPAGENQVPGHHCDGCARQKVHARRF